MGAPAQSEGGLRLQPRQRHAVFWGRLGRRPARYVYIYMICYIHVYIVCICVCIYIYIYNVSVTCNITIVSITISITITMITSISSDFHIFGV